MMYNEKMLESFSKEYAERCQVTDKITAEMFDANGVLRGLRDKNGNGVVAGLTSISKIEAFRMENGQKIPCDGNLWYRGYNVIDLVKGFEGKRCGFEEVAYLLLFGELPSGEQLHNFCEALATARQLENMINLTICRYLWLVRQVRRRKMKNVRTMRCLLAMHRQILRRLRLQHELHTDMDQAMPAYL